jgi:hypothetical protein
MQLNCLDSFNFKIEIPFKINILVNQICGELKNLKCNLKRVLSQKQLFPEMPRH